MPKAASVEDVFASMPQYFMPEQAAGLNAVLQLDITGEGGGKWNLTVADEKLHVAEGVAAAPSMTLTVAAADYLSLINGDASPMALFMTGKVKVRGDMQLALKLQTLFNMPS